MNLTCSLLLSTVKYPWTRATQPAQAKKIGLFDMELSAYHQACERLGWKKGTKFPFMLLMEAADDIAFSMSDLDDGLEKKIIRIEDLMTIFGEARFKSASVYPIVAFKTSVINEAIDAGAEAFTQNLDDILSGKTVRLLSPDSEVGELLKQVNAFARKNIYSHPAAERVELAGRSVVRGLLGHFKPLLDLKEEEFLGLLKEDPKHMKGRDFHVRVLRLLPSGYKEKYALESRGSEIDRRAHLIVDFVAGMTDDFALETYQVLQGIRIQ